MQITRRDSIKYSQLCGLPNKQRSSKMFKFQVLRVFVPRSNFVHESHGAHSAEVATYVSDIVYTV